MSNRHAPLQQAKSYILQGLFSLAESSLTEFAQSGGHAELLILEQLNLFYLSGNFSRWQMTLNNLMKTHQQKEHFLTFEVLDINEQIAVLKHCEEAGFIAEVLSSYERLLKLATNHENIVKIQAQRLRILSYWEMKPLLPEIYAQLLPLKINELSHDIFIEVQHALILAEIILFKPATSESRLALTLALEMDTFDKKLLSFDSAELNGRVGNKIDLKALQVFSVEQLDPYEEGVLSLLSEPEQFGFKFSEMSLSAVCRLYRLANDLEVEIDSAAQDQILFLLNQFSTKTKKIWIKYLDFEARNLISQAEIKGNVLISNDRTLSLADHPSLLAFLIATKELEGSPLLLEVLVEKLFQAEMDLSMMDRLRVQMNRLNKMIESELRIAKPFRIRAGQVNSRLKFSS